ncbi:HypC/HybG/HupF family hydrogenase formation chaperone [Desulfitobacterium sp. THU1]
MCLAIPARIVSIEDFLAKVDMMGNERVVGTHLVPDAQVGDYVLVHAGFAIEVVDQRYAEETVELLIEEANAREELQ